MKTLFAFLLLIASALLLLTLITGVAQIFTSIANTWTVSQTAIIAGGLSQVLWLGGIVFVMVLGFGLYTNFAKTAKGWGQSRHAPTPDHYQVLDDSNRPNNHRAMLDHASDNGDWYAFEEPDRANSSL